MENKVEVLAEAVIEDSAAAAYEADGAEAADVIDEAAVEAELAMACALAAEEPEEVTEAAGEAAPCECAECVEAAGEAVPCECAECTEAAGEAVPCECAECAEAAGEAAPCECAECVEAAEQAVPCECAECVEAAGEAVPCECAECVEAAVETEEEPVVAVEFDEDEEFVPAITFADDYDDPIDDRDDDYYESNAARVRIHMQEQEAKAEPVAAQTKKRTLGSAISNFYYHNKTACLIVGGLVLMVGAYLLTQLVEW